MATAARDRLGRLLLGDATSVFSTEPTARPEDLSLEVEGFGQVKFPVTPAKARRLIALGSFRHARRMTPEHTMGPTSSSSLGSLPKKRTKAASRDRLTPAVFDRTCGNASYP
jgi:hypothetical protein